MPIPLQRLLATAWLALLALSLACRAEQEPGADVARTEGESGGAVVLRIEGQLSVQSLALVARGIDEAKRDKRTVLVVDLDTPGGELETMWQLAKLIKSASDDADLRTVTWVHDRARSAGVLVTLATDSTYVTSRSTIGAATPVMVGPVGIQGIPEEGGVRAKLMSDMRAQFRTWAHGDKNRSVSHRPQALAEAMVDAQLRVVQVRVEGQRKYLTSGEWSDLRQSGAEAQLERTISEEGELLTLTGVEAVESGFVDGVADTLALVLEKSGAGDRAPLMLEAKSSEKLLSWLDLLTPVLIGLGLVLAFVELKMPGFGLPGTLSVVCFAVAFAGRYFVGLADVPHLVLVTVGFALIAVELFLVPGTVWFGLAGGVLVVGGLFWSQLGPGFDFENALDRRFAFDGAFQMLVTIAVALGAAMVVARFMPNIPLANRWLVTPREELGFGDALPELEVARTRARIGSIGEVRTDLRPVGKVVLEGDPSMLFEARSAGTMLERGTPVIVVEVTGDRLVVEPTGPEEA